MTNDTEMINMTKDHKERTTKIIEDNVCIYLVLFYLMFVFSLVSLCSLFYF